MVVVLVIIMITTFFFFVIGESNRGKFFFRQYLMKLDRY